MTYDDFAREVEAVMEDRPTEYGKNLLERFGREELEFHHSAWVADGKPMTDLFHKAV